MELKNVQLEFDQGVFKIIDDREGEQKDIILSYEENGSETGMQWFVSQQSNKRGLLKFPVRFDPQTGEKIYLFDKALWQLVRGMVKAIEKVGREPEPAKEEAPEEDDE